MFAVCAVDAGGVDSATVSVPAREELTPGVVEQRGLPYTMTDKLVFEALMRK
jgi:hypothetical protein